MRNECMRAGHLQRHGVVPPPTIPATPAVATAHLMACACSRAAVPATMGHAMEVPHICLYPPSMKVEKMPSPGASMCTVLLRGRAGKGGGERQVGLEWRDRPWEGRDQRRSGAKQAAGRDLIKIKPLARAWWAGKHPQPTTVQQAAGRQVPQPTTVPRHNKAPQLRTAAHTTLTLPG